MLGTSSPSSSRSQPWSSAPTPVGKEGAFRIEPHPHPHWASLPSLPSSVFTRLLKCFQGQGCLTHLYKPNRDGEAAVRKGRHGRKGTKEERKITDAY